MVLEAPLLQEKDIRIIRWGAMDFDPERSNRTVEERMERMDAEEDECNKEGGGLGWWEDEGEVRRAEGGEQVVNVVHLHDIGRRNAAQP
jgi:hypothetical protein